MQTLFVRGPSATVRMVVLIIASIVLMTVDHRWHSLELVRSAFSGVLYPLQYTIDLPIRLFYWADESLSTQQTLLEKNREFEARHLENRVQLQKLDIIEKENERLRKLLGAIPKTTERLLISEIINVDLDPYRQLILLNKVGLNFTVIKNNLRSHGLYFEELAGRWAWREVVDGNGNGLRTAEVRSGTDPTLSGPHRLEHRVAGVRLGFIPGLVVPRIPPRRGSIDSSSDPVRFGRSDLVSFSPLGSASSGTLFVTDDRDELFDEAVRFVVQNGQASTSMIQRRFRVGFSRAGRLIDMMERDGIIGPADGSKAREILVAPDYYETVDSWPK